MLSASWASNLNHGIEALWTKWVSAAPRLAKSTIPAEDFRLNPVGILAIVLIAALIAAAVVVRRWMA